MKFFYTALIVLFVSVFGKSQRLERDTLTIFWPNNSVSNVFLVSHIEPIEYRETNDTLTVITNGEIVSHYSFEGDADLEFNSIKSDVEGEFDLLHGLLGDTLNYIASDSFHFVNRQADYLFGDVIRVRKKSDTLSIAKIELYGAWGVSCLHYVHLVGCLDSRHSEFIEFGEVKVDKVLGLSSYRNHIEVIFKGDNIYVSGKKNDQFILVNVEGRVIKDRIYANKNVFLGNLKPGLYYLKSSFGTVQKIIVH